MKETKVYNSWNLSVVLGLVCVFGVVIWKKSDVITQYVFVLIFLAFVVGLFIKRFPVARFYEDGIFVGFNTKLQKRFLWTQLTGIEYGKSNTYYYFGKTMSFFMISKRYTDDYEGVKQKIKDILIKKELYGNFES